MLLKASRIVLTTFGVDVELSRYIGLFAGSGFGKNKHVFQNKDTN